MSMAQLAGRDLAVNNRGHLVYFDDWSPQVAEAIAAEEGLRLTECHWAVINFLREYYATHDMPPSPKVVIKGIGEEVSRHVPCTRRHLEAIFPNGGCKQACRVAGLPRYYCHSC